MKPLLYLVKHSLVNGVRRSIQSPFRAIATIVFLAWQLWWVLRAFFSVSASGVNVPGFVPHVRSDAVEVIVNLGFCFFAFVSWSTLLTLFQPPLLFQLADVDVTIPTPLSARAFLLFNFAKGYLARLLWPLFMLIFAARPFARMTRSGGLGELDFSDLSNAFKTATLAYIVMQLAWSTWRYATGLIWSESEQRSVTLRGIASWTCGIGGLAFLASIIYRASQAFQEVDAMPRLLALAKAPDVQVLLSPAVAAIKLGSAPVTGDVLGAVAGGVFLVVMAASGFAVMSARAAKVYEIAARVAVARADAKRFRTGQNEQGTNLMRARAGKLKAREFGFLTKIRLTGDMAFWWKEVVVLSRSAGAILIVFLAAPIVFGWVAHLISQGEAARPLVIVLPTFLLVLGPGVVSGIAQNGFRDFLRKGDLLRPLPLRHGRLLLVEVASKCVPVAIVSLLSLVAMALYLPQVWTAVLPTWLATVAMSLFAAVSALYLSILLPDQSDPAQNMFRRLIQGLGVTIFVYGIAIGFGALAFLNVWLAAAVVVPFSAGLTALCLYGATRAYHNFNPAD